MGSRYNILYAIYDFVNKHFSKIKSETLRTNIALVTRVVISLCLLFLSVALLVGATNNAFYIYTLLNEYNMKRYTLLFIYSLLFMPFVVQAQQVFKKRNGIIVVKNDSLLRAMSFFYRKSRRWNLVF